MTNIPVAFQDKLFPEYLPGTKTNRRSFGLYSFLNPGNLMFEISKLSFVLMYFEPVLLFGLQRRLDTLANIIQLPIAGLQITKECLSVSFDLARQIEDDTIELPAGNTVLLKKLPLELVSVSVLDVPFLKVKSLDFIHETGGSIQSWRQGGILNLAADCCLHAYSSLAP